MSDYRNEDGEYLMTAAEIRFEAELDHMSAMEQWEDRFLDNEGPDDEDECEECGEPNEPGMHDRSCHSQFDDGWDGPDEDAGMEYGLFGSEA